MLQSIQMKDVMSKNPLILSADTPLSEAVHQLLEHRATGATVLNSDRQVVGVVSEMDLLRAFEQISYYNQGDGKVSDYMTAEVEVIEGNTTIFDVAKRLLELKIRRMPVVENGKFVGLISCRGILQAMSDSMKS